MTRHILPRSRWQKFKDTLHHWWMFLTSKNYRAWSRFRWKPELEVIKPAIHNTDKELVVQPMLKPASLPVIGAVRFQTKNSELPK